MIIHKFRKYITAATVFLLLPVLMLSALRIPAVKAEEASAFTRPSVSGRLHVSGTDLLDEQGNYAVLRGVSTHGLTWYPDFVDEQLFSQLSEEWNCNLVRLAMYSELYCGKEKEENLALLHKGIEAAVKSDMYVLVDWHILNDYDPNMNIAEAVGFFDMISAEYAGVPNILYEICNEPNQDCSWNDVRLYSEKIIPVIRKNDPDAVIIVGTPDYDRNLMVAAMKPLDYDNIMYTLHFYTASHYDELFAVLKAGRDMGLPVFITECGLSEASGDGRVDYENARKWFSYLNEQHISYAVWSFSDKPETSAFVRPGSVISGRIEDRDLTQTGRFAKELIMGKDPMSIEVVAENRNFRDEAVRKVFLSAGNEGMAAMASWRKTALCAALIVSASLIAGNLLSGKKKLRKKPASYDELCGRTDEGLTGRHLLIRFLIPLSTFFSLIYLYWRIRYSVPLKYGIIPVAANLILLAVELLGFAETLIHYDSMSGMRDRPLPVISSEEYPDVDIFIATYNESVELLERTVRGCLYLKYPDRKKVHIWICDDSRRPEMRAFAERMGVGYFDRPDNEGAKAGNLNHAMSLTYAPYIVTLDADMIVRSEFLLKTIPYFIDAEKRNASLMEEERAYLGLLQTPQCFYDPDVFQHALYSERRAPNEQDFFYRTIECARTSCNSVIYGGSNTVLSRKALEDAGGFFTGSITEDFATGILIESAGYLSLAIPEPLASGRTPHTFREHIQQRTRWGRGVIVTAKKLMIMKLRGLSLRQKLSYWSSVIYWYSPIKNFIYMASPLLFSVFLIPVFRCSWPELLIYWLPMFLLQEICLRAVSRNAISTKWSGIYETSVMPHLFFPVLKETFGISLSSFRVTDKSGGSTKRKMDMKYARPFIVLALLSVFGIIRVCLMLKGIESAGLAVILFWLVRNLYFLIMALFLVDGRDSDGEPVHVLDGIPAVLKDADGRIISEGITTHLTEHSAKVYPEESGQIPIGCQVLLELDNLEYQAALKGIVTGVRTAELSGQSVYTVEITDFNNSLNEYMQILYDRIPTLPQNLNRDLGIIAHIWVNIARRLGDTKL